MTAALVVLGVVVLVLVIVLLYGGAKESKGEAKKASEVDVKQSEREARAKAIESEPTPVSPNAVADAWDRLRRVKRDEKSR